ncbi:hypothetical protein XELAEV_18033492mg, partial [Xenopus laevis]
MADNMDALLARIRAEAERRGDDWLWQLLPEEQPQQPPTSGMRTRRSRPPTRLSPSPPTQRRRIPSRSPQALTACGKGNGRTGTTGRDSCLTEERCNTPTTGPPTAQRGNRRSRQPSQRGSGATRNNDGGDSRHPQLGAEFQPQQLTEEERETSVRIGGQASNEGDAVVAGIGREHAQRQETGRWNVPSEQGVRSIFGEAQSENQRGGFVGGAQAMNISLGTELRRAGERGGLDGDPQTAAWCGGSALQGTSPARVPQAGPARGSVAGCQVWSTGSASSSITA